MLTGDETPTRGRRAQAEPASASAEDAIDRLLARPGRFAFLSAVALLQESGAELRFRHDCALSFPGRELSSVRHIPATAEGQRERFELVASFLGTVGAHGPAPVYLAELAAADDEAGELRRELLDAFHHRLYELLAELVRARQGAEEGLLAALGVGTRTPRRLDSQALLPLAPLLVARGRSAPSLAAALRHLMAAELGAHSASLELVEFAGEWVEIGSQSQFCLGDPRRSALGATTVVGAWCRDRASRVCVRIGPLPAAAATTFSPGGDAFAKLSEALAIFVREPVEVDLELRVVGSLTPPLGSLRLGVDFRIVAPSTDGRDLRFPLPLGGDPQTSSFADARTP